MTFSFSENLYWLSEDRQTLKEVWTKEPVNTTQGQKAVYILDNAFGIGGSAAKKLKLESGALPPRVARSHSAMTALWRETRWYSLPPVTPAI